MKRFGSAAIAMLLVCLACANPAYPQAYSVTSGSWGNPTIWSTNALPVDNAVALVTGTNTVSFGAGDSYAGNPLWWAGLGVGGGPEFSPNPGPGTLNITGGTLNTGAFFVGHQFAGTINLSDGILNASGQHMLFGWTAPGTMNITGGTMNMTGSGNLWNIGQGAASAINVSGGGVANFTGGIQVLNNSQINNNGGTVSISNTAAQLAVYGSTINQTSGTTTVTGANNLWLGGGGLTGTINLNGGTFKQIDYVRFGVFGSGNGVINQTSGTFEMGSSFEVWGGSASAYNLSGGTFRTTAAGVVFNVASGGVTFNITGTSGNVTMDTPFDFATPNTSTFDNTAAALTKTGAGTLTIGGLFAVDNGGFAMQAGTLETQSTFSIGRNNGTASGTMTGGTLRTGYIAASNLAIGNGGTGSLAQSGGAVDLGGQANFVVGWNSGAAGTYTLTGGTFTTGSNVSYVGLSGGSGTVNVNGGNFSAHNLYVGGNGAAAGTLNLGGGSFSVANLIVVGASGTVNVNSGGSVRAATSNNLLYLQDGGRINFNGGTGDAAMNILASNGQVDTNVHPLAVIPWANLIAAGTGTVLTNSSASKATINNGNTIWIWDGGQNLTIDTPAAPLEIASSITSAGQATATGVIKTGAGTLIYSGFTKAYTGLTQVNAGSLLVNNTISGTGGVTVAAGALLGGSGAIGGAVNVLGTLSPGNSPGVLSVASLVLGGSSTSLFEINNTTRGTGFDGVDITGVGGPTYGGVLSLVFGNGSAFGDTDVFDLFTFSGSTSGAFSSVTSTGFYAGTWTNNNDGTFKLEQGNQTLTFSQASGDIVVVPEPGALVLAGVGIAAAAWARRRRK